MPHSKSKKQASLSSRVNNVMVQILTNVFESESTLTLAEQESKIIPYIRLEKSPREIIAENQKLHRDLKLLLNFCQNIRDEKANALPNIEHQELKRLSEIILTKKTYFKKIRKSEDLHSELSDLECWIQTVVRRIEPLRQA